MNDCITLVVNGAEYASWSQASIKYAADAAARSLISLLRTYQAT